MKVLGNVLRLFLSIVLILPLLVSAEDNITLVYPSDALTCVPGGSVQFKYKPLASGNTICQLYHNSSGTWTLADFNVTISSNVINYFNADLKPGHIQWTVKCSNTTSNFLTSNFTFTLTTAPYCAVLSTATCARNQSLGSTQNVQTRLSNTNGIYLENQDCDVYIKNKRGEVVKRYNTLMVNAQTDLQYDSNTGQWINVAKESTKPPLTNSLGYYTFEYLVDSQWAWVGDAYTINLDCNGQNQSCPFNVTHSALPDVTNVEQLGARAGGLLALFGMLALFGAVFVGNIWRKLKNPNSSLNWRFWR